MVRPGITRDEIHQSSIVQITQLLIDFKVLNGSRDEHIQKESFKSYYPHGIGHYMGLDVHDQVPYTTLENKPSILERDEILTIEPGIYFPSNDMRVPESLRGIGIRIEDDILVTPKGYDNLTADCPKEIDDIEEACGKDYFDFLR